MYLISEILNIDKAAPPLYSANILQYLNVFVKCGKYVTLLLGAIVLIGMKYEL